MGACCCSCFGSDNDGEATAKETEMQAKKTAKSMAISVNMSAPSVQSLGGKTCGVGLALAGVAIEQDAAYWEWHIELPPRTHVDTILFGVTPKKERKFYKALEDKIQGEEGKKSVFYYILFFGRMRNGTERNVMHASYVSGRWSLELSQGWIGFYICISSSISSNLAFVAINCTVWFLFFFQTKPNQASPHWSMAPIGCEKLKSRMEMW
jgi:hypothetical protein